MASVAAAGGNASASGVASLAAPGSTANVAIVAAQGSQPGMASSVARRTAAADEATEGEGLPAGARKIADLEKPCGELHLANGDIYVSFSRAVTSLRKKFLLHSVFDGTIKGKNKTQDGCISYDIQRGSCVSMGGEIGKLSEFLSDDIQEVWGKDLQAGGKVLPKLLANGTVELYWSAKTEEEREACEALLTVDGVKPLFAMTKKGKELQPSGVLFILHSGVKFGQAKKVAKLPRQT